MKGHWKSFFLVILTVLTFSVLDGMSISPVHAAGQLYVSPPLTLTATTGTTLTIQVKVANVDPFTGWDIEVRTNPSVLNPQSISTDGNLLVANFSASILTLANCVNSQGTGCGPDDGLGVAHSAAAALGSRSLPPGPTSGLLFSITYKVLNGGSGVTVVDIIREVIANGVANSLVDVSVSNGVYGNSQDFGLELSPLFGSVFQGGEMTLSATITSLNGFTGQVNLTADSVLPAYVLPSSVFLEPDGSATAQLFASTTLCDSTTSYIVGLVGTSGNVTHSFQANPSVLPNTSNKPDFCFLLSNRSYSVNAGSSLDIPFILQSKNQFNGTVSMSTTVIPSLATGPTVGLPTPNATLHAGGLGSGDIHVSTVLQSSLRSYTVIVNATAGPLKHFLTISVSIKSPGPIFVMTTSSTVLTVAPASNTTDTITLTSLFGFSAPVALGTTIQPFLSTGPGVSLSLYTLQLSGSTNTTLTISAPRDAAIGSYNVTVFAMGGGISQSLTIRVNVIPLTPPSFTQFQWSRRISLQHDQGIETFKTGLRNPNKNTPIFIQVQIDGVDNSGTNTFHLTTGVVEVSPGHTITGISLSIAFTASSLGKTFSFSATILWGTSPGPLTITGSSKPGAQVSGSFTVIA